MGKGRVRPGQRGTPASSSSRPRPSRDATHPRRGWAGVSGQPLGELCQAHATLHLPPTAEHRPAPVHPGTCSPEAGQTTGLERLETTIPSMPGEAPPPPLREPRAGPLEQSAALPKPPPPAEWCAVRGPGVWTHPVVVIVRLHEVPVARLVVAEVGLFADQQVPGHLSQPTQHGHGPLHAGPAGVRLAPPLPRGHAQCRQAARVEAVPGRGGARAGGGPRLLGSPPRSSLMGT